MPRKFFNPFPRYLQIRNILLRRLQLKLAPGDRFPTENALSEEFGVSRETIREALSELEAQGLIERVRGRGTRVRRRPKNSADQRVTGLVEGFTELKRDTWTTLLAKEVQSAHAPIADELQLEPGDPSYMIRRLRFLNGDPFAVHEAHLPVELGVPLGRLDLTRTTISHELEAHFAVRLHEDYQIFDATIADPDFAQLLEVSVGAPLLLVRRRHLDQKDRPVVFFQTWFRSDRYFATIKFPAVERQKERDKASPRRRRAVAGAKARARASTRAERSSSRERLV